jgi:hypothetical protein
MSISVNYYQILSYIDKLSNTCLGREQQNCLISPDYEVAMTWWWLFQQAAAHHDEGEGEEDGDEADDDGKGRMTHSPGSFNLTKSTKGAILIDSLGWANQ